MANSSSAVGYINDFHDIQGSEEIHSVTVREIVKYVAPFGLLVNAIFLYVVARARWIRPTNNAYFASVAIADASYLATGLVRAALHTWVPALSSVSAASNTGSQCFLTAVAFKRFFTIHRPLQVGRIQASRCREITVTVGLWATTVVIGFVHAGTMIGRAWIYNVVFYVIFHVAVLLLNICLYLWVALKLYRHSTVVSAKHKRRLDRVVFTLLLTTALFVCLNAMQPLQGICTLFVYGMEESQQNHVQNWDFYNSLQLATSVTTFIRCSINPLVYGASNYSYYRRALDKAFGINRLASCCRGWNRGDRPDRIVQIELRDISADATYESQTLSTRL